MASCRDPSCEVDQELSALYIAPCDTAPKDPTTGKPIITETVLDDFERIEMQSFEFNRERIITPKRLIGACGVRRCNTKFGEVTGSMTVCVCLTNPTHCTLIAPDEICEFEWFYFPQPVLCNAPNVQTDAFVFGGGIISDAPWSFDPTSDESWTVDLSFQGCNVPLCRYNFCDQTNVEQMTVECAECNEQLNGALTAAFAA